MAFAQDGLRASSVSGSPVVELAEQCANIGLIPMRSNPGEHGGEPGGAASTRAEYPQHFRGIEGFGFELPTCFFKFCGEPLHFFRCTQVLSNQFNHIADNSK